MTKVFDSIHKSWHKIEQASASSFQTIDLHTGGEPLRVIYGGYPDLQHTSVLQFRDNLKENYDHFRKVLMWEPRGHADMYGCLITPPDDPSGDFGVVFLHNAGYSTMCGHAIIALTRLAALLEWKKPDDSGVISLAIDAPCGRIEASVDLTDYGEFPIHFRGVPSFVAAQDLEIKLDDGRLVQLDIGYGGAFYAYVNADPLGLRLEPDGVTELIAMGRMIKSKVADAFAQYIVHPLEPKLSFLYGTIFTSELQQSVQSHSRNVCIFADGEVDRSPTGSGASGRMALLEAKGILPEKQPYIIESLIGSKFKASYLRRVPFGAGYAVIPEVAGNAFVTGHHTFYVQPGDDLQNGFLLR